MRIRNDQTTPSVSGHTTAAWTAMDHLLRFVSSPGSSLSSSKETLGFLLHKGQSSPVSLILLSFRIFIPEEKIWCLPCWVPASSTHSNVRSRWVCAVLSVLIQQLFQEQEYRGEGRWPFCTHWTVSKHEMHHQVSRGRCRKRAKLVAFTAKISISSCPVKTTLGQGLWIIVLAQCREKGVRLCQIIKCVSNRTSESVSQRYAPGRRKPDHVS